MVAINDAIRIRHVVDFAVRHFDQSDWKILESALPGGDAIGRHKRLYRSLGFGDNDYAVSVAEVVNELVALDPSNLYALEEFVDGSRCAQDVQIEDGTPATSGHTHGRCVLFISHKAEEKAYAAALKKALACYGVDAFVAHEDIVPAAEWLREIERMLAACHAFVYLASPSANGSAWCQQEIGWAFGRGLPMVSASLGADPVGFLSARQSVRMQAFDPQAVAQRVFDVLVTDGRTARLVVDGLIEGLISSTCYDNSNWYTRQLAKAPVITLQQAERIEQAIDSNDQVKNANFGGLPQMLRNIIGQQKVPLEA